MKIHVETWRSSVRDFVLIFGLTTFNRTPGSFVQQVGRHLRHSLSLSPEKNRFSSLVRVCPPVRFTRKAISRKPRRPSGMYKSESRSLLLLLVLNQMRAIDQSLGDLFGPATQRLDDAIATIDYSNVWSIVSNLNLESSRQASECDVAKW